MIAEAAFATLVAACAPQVDLATARALVSVESGFNPHAIGVVRGVLERQPAAGPEALATARRLHADGLSFSVGLAQINDRNLARLGLDFEAAFEPCANLAAMQTLLADCFLRATRSARPRTQSRDPQWRLRQALSCYYSGNFVTGFDHGYVQRVVRASLARAA